VNHLRLFRSLLQVRKRVSSLYAIRTRLPYVYLFTFHDQQKERGHLLPPMSRTILEGISYHSRNLSCVSYLAANRIRDAEFGMASEKERESTTASVASIFPYGATHWIRQVQEQRRIKRRKAISLFPTM